MTKICAECGKEFEGKGKQKYCNRKHYRKCVICGQNFEISRDQLQNGDQRRTCSKKCTIELRKQTNTKKYGGVAPACSESVREKMQSTTLERYGVKHAAQADIFKEKSKQTALSKYGVEYYAKTDESKQKLTERWRDEEYKNKVVSKIAATNIERYGFRSSMQSLDVQLRNVTSKMTDSSKYQTFLKFKKNPREVIESLGLDHKPTLYELTSYIGVNESSVGVYIHLNNCEDLIYHKSSIMETDVVAFLKELDPEIVVSRCDRTIISPYEIDIYLPEYQIGIECNPTATHNVDINVFDNSKPTMSISYHQMKTNMCEDKGVRLIHIFGYEWKYKQKILKSIISNALCKNKNRIYARKCEIRKVDSYECSKFLNENHRQGKVGSSVRLGLYFENKLVSIMTFGKLRKTIGSNGDGYELLRFCSTLNTCVVGGASKLFNYFIKTYSPNYIRSFSDRAHTTGNIYKLLGFVEVNRSTPGYCWVNINTEKAYHRMNAQKQNIKKFLNDDSIDLTKSEREIMTEHRFARVFDSGTITWEWHSIYS